LKPIYDIIHYPIYPRPVSGLGQITRKFILANDDISILIKGLRQLLGFTQEQLAHELGVTFSTVNQWENGRRRPQPFLHKRLLEMKGSLEKASPRRFTKPQARAFTKGGQTIKAAEDEKLASMPMAEKFRNLAKLIVSAPQLGGTEGQAKAEEEEIRRRWMRLRRVLHA
jgi:putative transcriptional regulator